jgi:hypothetical protein
MVCHNSYRLYQIERVKSPAETRHADEQAARLASAVSSLFRGITRPAGAIRRPSLAGTRASRARPNWLAGAGSDVYEVT